MLPTLVDLPGFPVAAWALVITVIWSRLLRLISATLAVIDEVGAWWAARRDRRAAAQRRRSIDPRYRQRNPPGHR
jgi:hypothetical protein